MLFLEKLLLVNGATFKIESSTSSPVLGPLTGVCDYLSLTLGWESLWSGDGHCRGYLNTARTVALPCLGSGLGGTERDGPAKAQHRAEVLGIVWQW